MARLSIKESEKIRNKRVDLEPILPPDPKLDEALQGINDNWKILSVTRLSAIQAQDLIMNDLLELREANFEEKTPEFYQAGKAALIAAKELAVNIDSAVRARFYIPQPEDTDQASEVLKQTNSMISMHAKAYASSAIEVIE